MNWPLIEACPSGLLDQIINQFQIDPSDRQALAAACAAILGIENCWNDGTEDPAGYLEDCFAGKNPAPFYARNKHLEGMALETEYARMHQVKHAIATVSGEAAISLIIQAMTTAGDHILVSKSLFGTTTNNFKLAESQDGRKVVFQTLSDFDAWEKAIATYQPRMIFVESPTNPLANLADVRKLKTLLKHTNTRLVVDSTYAPAPMYKPLKLGADVVIESATKFFDGQTRVTGGLIATEDTDTFNALFKLRNAKGYNQVSFNALLLSYNTRSLADRLKQQSEHALFVAKALSVHPNVNRVHYLGLSDHNQHQLAQSVFAEGCFGSMLAFEVQCDDLEAGQAFKRAQQVANQTGFQVRANLGSVKTMITHPMSSTHSYARLSPSEIEEAGVTPTLLRLSVGLDTPETILSALDHALIT